MMTPTAKLIGTALTMLVLGSGCSRSPQPKSPYADDIRAASQAASSDFERRVFEDHDISAAEYQEAIQRFIDCIKGRGLTAAAIEQDGYYVYSISGTAADIADKAESECRSGTVALIEPIYVDRLRNPAKEDYGVVVLRCMKRKSLVGDDYTIEMFRADQEARFQSAPYGSGDDRLKSCLSNPQS